MTLEIGHEDGEPTDSGRDDLRKHGAACEQLARVSLWLQAKGENFLGVGNESVARGLFAQAESIDFAVEAIREVHRADFSRWIDSVGQSEVNMMNAALAGVMIATRHMDHP